MKNLRTLIALFTAALVLTSCSRAPSLVGTWRATTGKEVLTFAADGGLTVQSDKGTLPGKYLLLKDQRVMLELGANAGVGQIFTYEFVGPDLLLTEPGKAKLHRYVRAEPAATVPVPAVDSARPAGVVRGRVQTLREDPEKRIIDNLRQLAAAADIFYLENGVTTVRFDQLVGPSGFVKQIQSVEGENYEQLQFEQGRPLVITTPTGRTVRYKL